MKLKMYAVIQKSKTIYLFFQKVKIYLMVFLKKVLFSEITS